MDEIKTKFKQFYTNVNGISILLDSNGDVYTTGNIGFGMGWIPKYYTRTTNLVYYNKLDISNIKQVSCGDKYTMLLHNNGHVYTMGTYNKGNMGIWKYIAINNNSMNQLLRPFNRVGHILYGEAAFDTSKWSDQLVALSSDGSIVAIGATLNDGVNGENSGHVRVYEWNGTYGFNVVGYRWRSSR